MKKDQILFLKKLLKKEFLGGSIISNIIDLDENVIQLLNKNIDNPNLINAIMVATNEVLKKDKDYLTIIEEILATKETIKSIWATKLITDKNWINRNDKIKVFNELLSTKENFQSQYAYEYLTNDKVINDPEQFLIMSKIFQAKKEFQAQGVSYAASSPELIELNQKYPNKRQELLDKLLNTSNRFQAQYIALLFNNKSIIKNTNLDELIDKFLSIQVDYIAQYTYYLVSNCDFQKSEKFLEVVNKILQAQDDFQAKYIYQIATDKNFIDKPEYLSTIDSILEFHGKNIPKLKKNITKTMEKYSFDDYDSITSIAELIDFGVERCKYDFIIDSLWRVEEDEISSKTKLNIRIRRK